MSRSMGAEFTRYFRSPEGAPIRVRVEVDEDAYGLNPRKDECNWTTLITYGDRYESPDPAGSGPAVLADALRHWAPERTGRVMAGRVARWAAICEPQAIMFVGGLFRGGDADLILADVLTADTQCEGIAIVTREAWTEAMGAGYDGPMTPAEMARQELTRYNAWAAGECHGYVVERPAFKGANIDADPLVVESYWGYIGEPEYALSEGVANVPDGSTEISEDGYGELIAAGRADAMTAMTY